MTEKPRQRKRDAITTSIEDKVVLILEGWKPEWGRLSASALERKVTNCLGIACTRQGLLKRDRIKTAFDERMKLGEKQPKPKSAEATVLQQRIDRLEKLLQEKTDQVDNLHEVVTRFRYNAKLMGIPVERLEAPIAPLVGRGGKTA